MMYVIAKLAFISVAVGPFKFAPALLLSGILIDVIAVIASLILE
jgi:hypothetical protein